MLRLHAMEIAGFKSFRERIQVQFPEGITGVVGPNGCGKSNLLDAMCWVLGEQSAYALRGQRMGDLIFNGTRKRKPAPLAEVVMRLSGTNGNGDDRLDLTRRLYQSGDSEYLLNGEKVRLKDITNRLLGTGIGVRAYSVIHQGKVEEILSAKPEERRILIEEAAGITRYRAKRRSAVLKLERTEQDLLRVADILREVERQRNSLKRQANAARRFRRHKARERLLLRLEIGFRHRELAAAMQKSEKGLGRAKDAHAEAVRLTAETEARLESLRLRLEEQGEVLGERRDAQHRREREMDRLQHRIATARERAAELVEQVEARETEAAGRTEELEALATEIVELESAWQEAEQNLEAARESVDETEAEFRVARQDVERLEQEREEGREAVYAASSAIADHHNAAEAAREAAGRARAVAARFRSEAEEAAREESKAEEKLASARFALTAAEEELEAKREELSKAQRALTNRREEQDEARRAREVALTEESREESRLALLRKLDEEGERCAGGVRALLDAAREAGIPGFRGLLADHLDVEEGYEGAVEAALRERLQWVLVEGPEAARAAADKVREAEAGGASFLFATPDAQGEPATVAPPGTRPLREVVRTDEPRVSEALRVWLRRAFLAEDAAQAGRLAAEHPGHLFVTREGGCWGPGPVLHQQGSGTEGGVLRLKREIREAEEAWGEASHRRAGEEARCQRLERQIEEIAAQVDERTQQVRSAERGVFEAEHAVAASEQNRDRLRNQIAMLRTEAERSAEEASRHDEEMTAAELRASEAEERKEQESSRLEDLRRLEAEAENHLQSVEEELRRLREVLADRRETREAARLRLEHARKRLEDGRESLERMERETRAMRERREELLARAQEDESSLNELLAETEQAADALREAEEAVTGTRLELQEAEKDIKERRRTQEAAAEAVSEAEVRLAELRADREHLRRECRTDLGEEIEQVVAAGPPSLEEDSEPADGEEDEEVEAAEPRSWDDEELPALEEIQEELTTIRGKLERIGSVNLVAIEEFEEQDERFRFLQEQQADIQESIEALRRTIREIDETCRERFTEAFTKVREYFMENFKILFTGGEADLRLEESEDGDVLAAGIDIFAQPPGKRLQNIRLLSGGEKALSAIALLFALFRYKPSPFCVLDEVDAPLDDANLTRFLELIEAFNDETQFILITHNKLSMQKADVLYGVTMQEPGCSKVVSVDFREMQTNGAGNGNGTEAASKERGNGDGALAAEAVGSEAM